MSRLQLNVTHKILPSGIASALDFLIHENQQGFISGRFIGENARLIYGTLHLAKERGIQGTLLLVDFGKAFDSVFRKFVQKVKTILILEIIYLNW